MPFALLASWTIFAGCVNSHQRHAADFGGASAGFRLVLRLSTMAGFATGLGLLIYYFTQSTWYWPLLLFLGSSIAAGLIFAILDALLGRLLVIMVSFICWPICAYWSYCVTAQLAQR